MKEEILKLRSQGLSYAKIAFELNCSKSTVAYHCNNTTKDKAKINARNNPNTQLVKTLNTFRAQTSNFGYIKNQPTVTSQFGYKDVINKFGTDTVCYLTGTPINLYNDACNFDHIIPRSKGGDNSLDNLGITIPKANRSKSDMLLSEYLELCKQVLIHNGYTVKNPEV